MCDKNFRNIGKYFVSKNNLPINSKKCPMYSRLRKTKKLTQYVERHFEFKL